MRFFGRRHFDAVDAESPHLGPTGYTKGVPIGADLSAPPKGSRPARGFLVSAIKDPEGAHIDRIEIVRRWVDGRGESHECVYDAALSNDRKADRSGRAPAVGNTVDVARLSCPNTIGDAPR